MAPTALSNIGDELAELHGVAITMIRDACRGDRPTLRDADALVAKAEEIRLMVTALGLEQLTGKPLGDLVVVDDAGAQRVMAEQHHAAADAAEQAAGAAA